MKDKFSKICVHWIQSEIHKRVWPHRPLSGSRGWRGQAGWHFPVGRVRGLLRIALALARGTRWSLYVCWAGLLGNRRV